MTTPRTASGSFDVALLPQADPAATTLGATQGLSGRLAISITEGRHCCKLNYSLPG